MKKIKAGVSEMVPGDNSIASASPLVPANYNLADIFSKINPKDSQGYSIADVYDFFDKMDYQTDRATVEGKSNGTITALECAAALSKEIQLTEAQKNAIHNAILVLFFCNFIPIFVSKIAPLECYFLAIKQ